MANDASRMTGTLGKEDGLYLGLEKLVVQRRRCGGGRDGLALRLPQRPGGRQEQTRYNDHVIRRPSHSVHGSLPTKLGDLYSTLERMRVKKTITHRSSAGTRGRAGRVCSLTIPSQARKRGPSHLAKKVWVPAAEVGFTRLRPPL